MTATDKLSNRTVLRMGSDTGGRTSGTRRKGNPRLLIGIVLLIALVFIAVFAPAICPMTCDSLPIDTDLSKCDLPPLTPGYPLGTDSLGRNVLSQCMWGARASLFVGLTAATLAVAFGCIWGSLSAMAGGIVDSIMMRIVDGLLAVPSLIMLLVLQSLLTAPQILALVPKPLLDLMMVSSISNGLLPIATVICVIAATTWLEAARLARARVLTVKSEEYITAARALGVSDFHLLFRHLIPNIISIVIVESTLLVSDAVMMEAGLGFLGLGLGPSTPSWGRMLAGAQYSLLNGNWWSVAAPGLLITTTILAVHMLADGWLEILGVNIKSRAINRK